MSVTTISSRKFNQNVNDAKRSARSGPVFITDRGKPSYVLLSIEQYKVITGSTTSVVDLLAMPEAAQIEFEPARLSNDLAPSAKF